MSSFLFDNVLSSDDFYLTNNNQQYIYQQLQNNNDSHLAVDTSKATLWMGDLEPWMDESFLKQLWNSYGEPVIIKLIRDKRTGFSSGYAFIGFSSTVSAQKALNNIHGTRIPSSNKCFRLNWASGGGIYDRKEDRAPEYSLFVGDLSNDVDETFLLSLFRNRYPSCHSAKIMTDPLTGLSRGYGFVRFLSQLEQQEAVITMNGIPCHNRPLRVSFATPKSNNNNNLTLNTNTPINYNERYYQLALQAPALVQQPTDPNNTTVFVGGLSTPISEDQLRHYFSPFGEITYVKIPPGKGCGFVQYVTRSSAEQAIEKMNGFVIGNSRIRLSWGKSQTDKSNNHQDQQQLSPSTLSTSSTVNNGTSFTFQPLSSPTLLSTKSIFDNDWLFSDQQQKQNTSNSWHLF